ncbi:MAG: DUF2089 domain-containing protein [Calditrichaeota bacterium]|nr:MAG: DUF2089 domain-containing protein [Calditrichota bacterium]
MKKDWSYITKLSENKQVTVQKVRIDHLDMAIEADFELPPLAKLAVDDQIFAAVFLKSHGSIKEMEKHFGVSYPTIKNRLNRISTQLDFVEVETTETKESPLDLLERGDIDVEEAIKRLDKGE